MSLLTAPRASKSKPQPSRLPLRYLDDTVLISEDEAWTVMWIPPVAYDFLPAEQQVALAARFTLALTALAVGHDPIDAHLIVTNDPYDTNSWAQQLNRHVSAHKPRSGWVDYLSGMAGRLDSLQFLQRNCYLAIGLGRRSTKMTGALREAIAPITKLVKVTERAAGFDDYSIDADEIEQWTKRAIEVRRSLSSSHLHAVGCNSDEVAHLIQRPFWPAMQRLNQTTDMGAWGKGSIEGLVEGELIEQPRSIEVRQADDAGRELVGHSVAVSVYRFPDEMRIPQQEPWLLMLSELDFPVDISIRFTIEPPSKVKKDIQGRLNNAREQAAHIAEAGVQVPLHVSEALDTATALEFQVDKQMQPWVYARHRFHVWADTAEEAAARAQRVTEKIRESGLTGTVATGDQLDLFLEQIPGTPVRANAYLQRHAADILGGGMPHATVTAGDHASDFDEPRFGWTGAYHAYSTYRQFCPMHIDPHSVIARNKSGGCGVTGQPGGGKSFSSFSIAYQMASAGVWTIVIDPGGAALPMAQLPGLDSVQVFDLKEGYDGLLDPFLLGENRAERKLLALEITDLLLKGKINMVQEEALLQAVDLVAREEQPSMAMLVDLLQRWNTPEGRTLGAHMKNIAELPFARLCFAPNGGAALNPAIGLTVISLLGLRTPEPGRELKDYGWEERLGSAIMFLLTTYTRKLLFNSDKNHPKAVFVDEAWAVTATDVGRKLIEELSRTGRKHNTVVYVITQNAKDLMNGDLANQITTRLAFRTLDGDEITKVLEFFGLPNEEMYRDMIRNLQNGECLYQDADRRVARIKFDAWNAPAKAQFDTNPHTRAQSLDQNGT